MARSDLLFESRRGRALRGPAAVLDGGSSRLSPRSVGSSIISLRTGSKNSSRRLDPRATARYQSPPVTQDGLLLEVVPRRRLADLSLSAETATLVSEVVEEQRRRDVLRAHGLEPRHRFLLVGAARQRQDEPWLRPSPRN